MVLVIGIFPVGCSRLMRAQSPDNEGMEFNEGVEGPTYIGDIAGPAGLDKLKVDGIALITQLNGTGSEPSASQQREYLIDEIKTHQVDDIPGLLADKDNSIALIMGFIPAGAVKGDRFDVLVKCPDRSETTSLDGGYLMQARMKPFVQTRRNIQFGHNYALARGRVAVDSLFESGDEDVKLLSGMVIGGGIVTRDRATTLKVRPAHRSIKHTTAISRAVNARFSTYIHGAPDGVANPVTDRDIEILIPEDYRHNVGRYFHVILNIVFNETADQRVNRLERLERELHNPEKASLAAIRLEAIGEDAVGVLKRGLRSENMDVQFHAAEALAYLQDHSGADILREAADTDPAFRWHALKALESIGDSVAEDTLSSLFNSDSSEARYGAFQALRDSQPESIIVNGEHVGRELMLHTVPSTARPMIHISRTRVPEVVIFGGDQHFTGDLLYFESGLTIQAEGDSRVQVKRYLPHGELQQLTCTTLVSDVIRTSVKLGAKYGDIIRLLKDAKKTGALPSELVINALPKLRNSYRATNVRRRGSAPSNQPVSTGASQSSAKAESKQGKGIFGKMKGFWSP